MAKRQEKIDAFFLITVDCLRKDYETKEIMPFLSSLKGIRCRKFVSNSPFTAASFPSIFLSKYATEFGSYLPLPETDSNIFRIMKERGYLTAGFSSNANLTKFFRYDQGFDHFADYLKRKGDGIRQKVSKALSVNEKVFVAVAKAFKPVSRIIRRIKRAGSRTGLPYPRAEKILDDTLNFAKSKKMIFAWTHIMDAHGPLCPPEEFRKKAGADGISKSRALSGKTSIKEKKLLYKASCMYVDDELKRFVMAVKTYFLNPVFIITADHGELLGEHGLLAHPGYLYNQLLEVPFIIHGKKIKSKKADGIFSSVDIAPTILDLLSIEKDKYGFNGESILKKKGKYAFSVSRHTKLRGVALGLKSSGKGARLYSSYCCQNMSKKAVYDEIKKKYFFYDTKKDPCEKNPEKFSQKFGEIKAKLDEFMDSGEESCIISSINI